MSAARRKKQTHRNLEETAQGPVSGGKPMDRLLMMRRVELVFALALTVVIVLLHVYRATKAGALWRDEVTTLVTATLPSISEVWSAQVYTRPPLLPYGIVRIWAGIRWLGSGDNSLRVLGALTGIGVLLVLWWNTRLLGYHAPVFSLVLFGLNVTVIIYGDSLRGYAVGSLLILLTFGLVWKVVESPTSRRVLLAALVSILSVQCLFQNAILLFSICLGGSLVCLRKRMWKRMLVVLGIGAISALSLLPYLGIITKYQGILDVVLVPSDFSRTLNVFLGTLSSGNDLLLWAWYICCGISILGVGLLVMVGPKGPAYEKRLDLAIYSLTVLVISAVSFFPFMKESRVPAQYWHCIVWMSAMALSIEVLMEQLITTSSRRIGRLVLALAMVCVAIPITWKQIQVRETNIDIIVKTLQERTSKGDLIVLNPWHLGITFQHYYRGEAAWTTIPPIRDLGLVRFDLLEEQIKALDPLQPVYAALQRSLSSGNRVWWIGDIDSPPEGQLPPPLPRPPTKPDGLFLDNYHSALTVQIGYFIQSHATSFEPVDLHIAQRVIRFEDPSLSVFRGWQ